MNPRLRFALRFNTAGLVILLVMLAVVALLGPPRDAYVAVEATPMMRTIMTMAIALSIASLAGLATWRRIWREDEADGPALAAATGAHSTPAPVE